MKINLEDRLLKLSNKCNLAIAGAITGLAAPIAKLAGDYLIFDKTLADQLHNSQQLFDYGLMTAGAIATMAAAGSLVEKIMQSKNESIYKDSLTGAYNKRYLQKTEDELRQSKDKYTIVLIDLDNFKPINDTYGHQIGDEALQRAHDAMRSELKRIEDVIVRIGGDEFVLHLPSTDEEGASRIIERMRQKVGQIRYGDIQMEFSAGIVTKKGDFDDFKALMHEADLRMYAEKSMKKSKGTR